MEIAATKELLDANTNKVKLQLSIQGLEKKLAEHEQRLSEFEKEVPAAEEAYQSCLREEILNDTPANKKATRKAKQAWETLETEHDEVKDLKDATSQTLDKVRQDFEQAKNRARMEAQKALREGAAPYFHDAQNKIKEALPQFIAAWRLMNGISSNYEGEYERLGNDRAVFDKGKEMADLARHGIENAVHAEGGE